MRAGREREIAGQKEREGRERGEERGGLSER